MAQTRSTPESDSKYAEVKTHELYWKLKIDVSQRSLTRVRGDRFFARVDVSLRDEVKNSILTGLFHEVPNTLREPPPGFIQVDSFKTRENYGNLQLTFFCKEDAIEFLVDADLDEAQGIEHIFQALGHALTGGETHPSDIHQILLAHHGVDPGYELVV